MENDLDGLVRQAKNNINILSVTPISDDSVVVHFEFQYRPRAGAQPHWVKTCKIVPLSVLDEPESLHNLVIAFVKIARAGLEG